MDRENTYIYRGDLESRLDIIGLFSMVWKHRVAFCMTFLLGVAASVAIVFLAKPVFRAQAVIGPSVQNKLGSASAAALATFGGIGAEIAGSMGIQLPSTDANRLEALLRSFRLLDRVVGKHGLLPVLFADRWNSEKGIWTVDNPTEIPDVWDAKRKLEKVLLIKGDIKTGTISLSLELGSHSTAKEVLEFYLDELSIIVREDELDRIVDNKTFVKEQLDKAVDPILIVKLQSMLSDLYEKEMMAQNVENFAYYLVDPAFASNIPVSPNRKLIVAAGILVGIAMGIVTCFIMEAVRSADTSRCR